MKLPQYIYVPGERQMNTPQLATLCKKTANDAWPEYEAVAEGKLIAMRDMAVRLNEEGET